MIHKGVTILELEEVEPGYWPLVAATKEGKMKVYVPDDLPKDKSIKLLEDLIKAIEITLRKIKNV